MELIYADRNCVWQGVLKDWSIDLECGTGNTFELQTGVDSPLQLDMYVLFPDTNYGGVIDGFTSDGETVYWHGRTWQGIMASKVMLPDYSGSFFDFNANAVTVHGDMHQIIDDLIAAFGLPVFSVSGAPSVQVGSYTMPRFCDLYSGLQGLAGAFGKRLDFTPYNGGVEVFAASQIEHVIRENVEVGRGRVVNHLVCLGQGELENRTIVHLFADADGNISTDQSFFEGDEIAEVYDYPNAESAEVLEYYGVRKLSEYQAKLASVDFTVPDDLACEVGDTVTGKDFETGASASQKVTGIVVKGTDAGVDVSYTTGDTYKATAGSGAAMPSHREFGEDLRTLTIPANSRSAYSEYIDFEKPFVNPLVRAWAYTGDASNAGLFMCPANRSATRFRVWAVLPTAPDTDKTIRFSWEATEK